MTNAVLSGGVMKKRVTVAIGRVRYHAAPTPSAASSPTTAAACQTHSAVALRAAPGRTASIGTDSDGGSSSRKRMTATSGMRALRSLARQRCMIARRCGGSAAGSAVQSGSPRRIAASVSETSSPSNARFPVSISNSTQPNAQTSLRLSAARPFACSGLMYAAVPRITPACVAANVKVGECDNPPGATDPPDAASNFASPKSSTFTCPSCVSMMLAGFRSRWMIPLSCAASSASTICRAVASASSMDSGPAASRSASDCPSTSSSTRNREPPTSSRPWMPPMCG